MTVAEKLRQIEQELTAQFLERREPIRGLLVGLLARQHVLLLGPPGTAKSELARAVCSRVAGAQWFYWLLGRTSTPEELFGPVSLRALEQDSYRRVTAGKLPEAHVAFLDEVFKANAAVLNLLLAVLNERIFHNDGTQTAVPLITAVGASNELPEDLEELGALWDRFLLRYVVDYIRDPRHFERLLTLPPRQAGGTAITLDELAAAQVEVQAVDVRAVVPTVVALRSTVAGMGIRVSDRRWRQSLSLVQAHAWLEGRTQATADDLEILTAALWDSPEQIPQIRQAVMAAVNPLDQEALELLDQATEIHARAMAAPEEKATEVGMEANTKLKRINERLATLRSQARETGRSTARIDEVAQRVATMQREVLARCLGITI